MADPTLDTLSLFGSNDWAARRLGITKDTFFRKRTELETAGFPKPDPLTGRYIKADVDAWVDRRRQIGEAPTQLNKGSVKFNEL